MTENPILSKNSARAAGVLTLSGLMVGGVALAQGAGAAPEVQPAAQVTKAVTLDAFHQELSYVPASLARPEIAPKSHEQLAQEKAEREAEERAAAEREKAEREAREAEEREAAEREQAEREAQEREAAEAEAEQPAAEEQAAAEQVEAVEATAPQAEQVRTIEAAPAAQQSAPAQTAGASTGSSNSGSESSSASGKGQAIAAAAKAQIGRGQDCTALVSNSLRAVGINFHGWPKDYLSLGHTVSASEAQPGDIIYYASNGFGQSHVAIYIGNGQAIHGGWNNGTTAQFSANLPTASSPVFIRVDR